MKKAIGGLLLISMLSSPYVFDLSHVANLLKEREGTMSKIQSVMDFNMHIKKPLNDEQISGFVGFMTAYNGLDTVVGDIMQSIDKHSSTDMAQEEILSYQTAVIENLNGTISAGHDLLQML